MSTTSNLQPAVFKTIADLAAAGAKTGAELVEVSQGGLSRKMPVAALAKFNSYDVAIGNTTQLNTDNQVFVIQNTEASPKAVTLPAVLPAGRAMTLVVVIYGKVGAVTWDALIKWNGGAAPVMGNAVTTAVLLWDGANVHGNSAATY